MKFFIVLTLFAIAFSVNAADITEQDKLVQEHIEKCQGIFPVDKEELAQLKEGKITDGTENARCFVNCFMEESGLIKNDVFDKEASIQKFTVRVGGDKAKSAVDECGNESGPAKCETALKLHNCFHAKGVY